MKIDNTCMWQPSIHKVCLYGLSLRFRSTLPADSDIDDIACGVSVCLRRQRLCTFRVQRFRSRPQRKHQFRGDFSLQFCHEFLSTWNELRVSIRTCTCRPICGTVSVPCPVSVTGLKYYDETSLSLKLCTVWQFALDLAWIASIY